MRSCSLRKGRVTLTDGVFILDGETRILNRWRQPSVAVIKSWMRELLRGVIEHAGNPAVWVKDTIHVDGSHWSRAVMVTWDGTPKTCTYDQKYCRLLAPEPPVEAVWIPASSPGFFSDHFLIRGGTDRLRWLLMPMRHHADAGSDGARHGA
jgi:hypothetical protein